MSEPIFYPVVSNRKTNDLYFFRGGTTFENIKTNKTGEVPVDLANKVFAMEPIVSQMINDFPLIGDLIKKLELKIS